MAGVPAKIVGWVCDCARRMDARDWCRDCPEDSRRSQDEGEAKTVARPPSTMTALHVPLVRILTMGSLISSLVFRGWVSGVKGEGRSILEGCWRSGGIPSCS